MSIPGISLALVSSPHTHTHRYTAFLSLKVPGIESYFSFCPVVVAEVTQPSLGVGYELGRAVALGKPILCLFRPQSGRGEYPSPGVALPWLSGNPIPVSSFPGGLGQGAEWGAWKKVSFTVPPSPVLSAMIRGAADGSRFQVWDYAEGEVETMVDRYFEACLPQEMDSSSNPSA